MLKLEHYGIRNSIVQLISAFLSSCTQQIVYGGTIYSSPAEWWCSTRDCNGASSFINDILSQLASTCLLYANDCILYRKIETQANLRILQDDLKCLKKWALRRKMRTNACMVLTVTLESNPPTTHYILHNHHLI